MTATGSSNRSERIERLCLAGVLGATLIAAVMTLGLRPVLGDEFGSIWLAGTENVSGILQKIRTQDVHPPTHYLFLHAWGGLFGYGDAAMRWSSLLFTMLAFATGSRLTRQWTRDAIAPSPLPLVLLATAPVLWVMGISARYYAAAAWLGLMSTYCYLRWLRDGGAGRWWALVAANAAAFYLNYLTAGLLVCSQAAHVLASSGRLDGRRKAVSWMGAQVATVLVAAPVLCWNLWPLITGESVATGSSMREGVSGLAALPVVLAGHLYTLFTGGIPHPWRAEIVIPAILGGGMAAWSWFRSAAADERRDAVWLIAFPFLLTAIAIAVLVPAAGYFRGLLRAGYIPILAWILLVRGADAMSSAPRRTAVMVLLLVANLSGLWLLFLNKPSMVQDHPVKEIIGYVQAESRAGEGVAVVHPFEHGWGDAVARYRPAWTMRVLTDADSMDDVQDAANEMTENPSDEIWIVRQNRFSRRASDLAARLEQAGYVRFASRDFQPQAARDIRFKEWIKSVSILGFRPDSSYPHILTVQGFRRGSP